MPRTARRDFGFAFAGQVSIAVVGIVRTLLIPLLLGADIHAYASWQAYLLYVGYISVGYWGFNDGFYVRHPKLDDDPSRRRLSSSLVVDSAFLLGEAFAFIAVALSTGMFADDTAVWVAVFANLPLTGLYGALTYHLQLTGKIDRASVIVSLEKVIFLVGVVGANVTGHLNLASLIAIEITSKLLMTAWGYWSGRATLLRGPFNLAIGLAEFRKNLSVGIKLMLGTYFALLLTGVVRIFVQTTASAADFAYYALAFSVTSIIFLLGQAITVVLYPHLSRGTVSSMGEHFVKMNRVLSLLFPVILLGYYPGAIVLRTLLPRYELSGYYLGFLLPVIGFQLIVGTLNGTYYRLLRQEKRMFVDNTISVLVLIALCLALKESIVAMTLAQILVLAFRAWHSQRQFRTQLLLPRGNEILAQLAWTATFLLGVHLHSAWLMGLFAVGVLGYLVHRRAELASIYGRYLKRPDAGGEGSTRS